MAIAVSAVQAAPANSSGAWQGASPGELSAGELPVARNGQGLPPGRLRQRIESLPQVAQERALLWLQRFEIPEQDYAYLQIDNEGGVYYSDTELPAPPDIDTDSAETALVDSALLLSVAGQDSFSLHSRPGAERVVFLDFDGHDITGTAWNSGASTYYAKPYSTDADGSTFSDAERAAIAEIWHRVAEDMAPFDIDVTTEDPGQFGPLVGHVLITPNTDETGAAMPANGGGGVAYVGVWGYSNYTNYQPALVYYENLASFSPYIAEAASHEFGHNLSLAHDGSSTESYYRGHGSGAVSWAPIMGVGYYQNVTQWSAGEYLDANNTQDDLQAIGDRLGYRDDDHGDSRGTASALALDANGTVFVTTPEMDPHNSDSANKGVIETRTDSDVFWFDSGAGALSLNITPAWDAFYRSSRRGANLDIEATLYDALGNPLVSSDPLDETLARIDTTVAQGRYYLAITGVGNTQVPYSDYGSLGMYFITGTVPGGDVDITAPTPDPMTWVSVPAAINSTQIDMATSVATDDSGVVEYQFQCTASTGAGCATSAWQGSNQFSATGLSAATLYSFQARARDGSGNMTAWSPMASATTAPAPNQAPVAQDDTASTLEAEGVTINVLSNDSDADGDSLSVASFTQASNGSVIAEGASLRYVPNAGFSGTDGFSYVATDGKDLSGSAWVSVSVTAVSANTAPVALDDSAEVAKDSAVSIAVLANDSDIDGDTISILSWTQGGKGSVELSADGTQLVYSRGSRRGGDTFTYTITDGALTAQATVSVSLAGKGGDGSVKCHPKKGC
uniref:Ig-like domain-containing protein n=1 Tax=Marinobacterium profundum TaxID=1714300 RepID=UPI00083706F9|nr:Ig-like domain-containing protein [Marinobacterium profundum]